MSCHAIAGGASGVVGTHRMSELLGRSSRHHFLGMTLSAPWVDSQRHVTASEDVRSQRKDIWPVDGDLRSQLVGPSVLRDGGKIGSEQNGNLRTNLAAY